MASSRKKSTNFAIAVYHLVTSSTFWGKKESLCVTFRLILATFPSLSRLRNLMLWLRKFNLTKKALTKLLAIAKDNNMDHRIRFRRQTNLRLSAIRRRSNLGTLFSFVRLHKSRQSSSSFHHATSTVPDNVASWHSACDLAWDLKSYLRFKNFTNRVK